jgi:hypothetical protein
MPCSFGKSLMFWSNISLSPSISKSKQGKKPTEASGKLSSLAAICKLNGITSQKTSKIAHMMVHFVSTMGPKRSEETSKW